MGLDNQLSKAYIKKLDEDLSKAYIKKLDEDLLSNGFKKREICDNNGQLL